MQPKADAGMDAVCHSYAKQASVWIPAPEVTSCSAKAPIIFIFSLLQDSGCCEVRGNTYCVKHQHGNCCPTPRALGFAEFCISAAAEHCFSLIALKLPCTIVI